MDDGVVGGAWSIEPETRTALRLEQVRHAVRECAWSDAILEAEELLDEYPEHPEALFLLGEALLEVGDWELARRVYDHRVGLDGGDTASLVGLAISSFHLCDLPASIEAAREAVRQDSGNAEAHHYLGLALERIPGQQTEALAELTASAHLDPARYPLPLTLRPSEWADVIAQAVDTLPSRIQEFYAKVPFRVESLPDLDELRSVDPPLSPTVGALYVGTPPEEPSDALPEAVRLFERNLSRAGSVEAITTELAHALHDEALDWMGEDDELLDQAS
ncbi:MAG: tetratricopeptide repeat protein [Myxococcota bacterium]